MRIEFYLMDSDKRFFCDFPCRLNVTDQVFMDFLPEHGHDMDDDPGIQSVECVIFDKDKQGIFQRVYLTNENIRLTTKISIQ